MAKKRNTKTVTITGFGGIGRSWLRAVRSHPDFELIGIIDIDTELLENVPKMVKEIDDDCTYTSIEHAVHRIIFQQMSKGCGIGEIIDGNDLDIVISLAGPEKISSYSSKSVNPDFHRNLLANSPFVS